MKPILDSIAVLIRRSTFRSRRAELDAELREEMQFHVDMLARANESGGMSADAARVAARRQFGNPTTLCEFSREQWSFGWLDALWQDVRYGVRSLIRTPSVTITALITLILAIGATATVVALLDATQLHPVALPDADRIVTISQTTATCTDCNNFSSGNYVSVRDARTVLQDVAFAQDWGVTVPGPSAATVAEGMTVTPNYSSVLGVTPMLGRSFTARDADASVNRPTVVVLSHRFWLRQFDGDPTVIGRSIALNDVPRTIIGVLRKNDGFPPDVDVFGPLHLAADAANDHKSTDGFVVGRLRPGATAADATRDISAIERRLARESPATNAGWRFVATPLTQYRTADVRQAVLLVVGAVAGVLLIACANVANLLLVRATAREREIAVRAALGAGRAQIARQLVIEGVVLSLTGGLLGIVLGAFGVTLLKRSVPADLASYLPGWAAMGVNVRVLLMMLGVSIAVGVGFSAFPAFRAARTDLTGALKQGARGSTVGRGLARVRTALVIGELALAVVLLSAAGLLVQSFTQLTAADTGVHPEHVLTMQLHLPATLDADAAVAYHEAVVHRVESIPGIRRAALIDKLPLSNSNNSNNFIPDSRPTLTLMQAPSARDEFITAGYFSVMGIPLVRGRDFNELDRDTAAHTVIINREFASRYWPNGDAIGHTIRTGYEGHDQYTIVGIVGNVRYAGADEPPRPEVYRRMNRRWDTDIAVQTSGGPAAMAHRVVAAIGSINPSVAITRVMTMDAMMARHYAFNRVIANGLAIFAGIALIIAAAGIYGVVSYSVGQRTQEIGLRMALGAGYGRIMGLILADGARVAVIGVVLGLIGAWFAGSALAFLLYGVAPRDPATFAGVALILGAVAIAASYFPARRAGRVDPVTALRYE